MAYYCPEYECVAHELPCPYCGDTDHDEIELPDTLRAGDDNE